MRLDPILDRDRLPMWVVYDHPSDHPDHYVARLWFTLPREEATDELLKAHTLQALRRAIQDRLPGAVMLYRNPEDHEVIMETWL